MYSVSNACNYLTIQSAKEFFLAQSLKQDRLISRRVTSLLLHPSTDPGNVEPLRAGSNGLRYLKAGRKLSSHNVNMNNNLQSLTQLKQPVSICNT